MIYDIQSYSIADFLEWDERGTLSISPKYQRGEVWNDQQKSYLIDTILKGLPIPPIFLREITDVKLQKTKREVIDGQQRLNAVFQFVKNIYKISPSQTDNIEYKKKKYEKLEEEDKKKILYFKLSVLIINTDDDATVYDMFSRINTNSVTLNPQEIRNSKFYGLFKTTVYYLVKEYKNKFLILKIFNHKNISRMDDAKFISDLLILMIEDDIQGANQTLIDQFYKKYNGDDSFKEKEIKENFKKIFNFILCVIEKNIFSYFIKENYIYTFFAYLKYLKEKTNLEKIDINKISNIISNLESQLKEDNEYIIEFKNYHKGHTTNKKQRESRIEFFKKYMDNELLK